MTAVTPERGTRAPTPLPRTTVKSEIESEIVIVDENGVEEPFDAASWFE
jgi:hypothetical protein